MLYALMGFASGILSGMGLGGGTLLIPLLTIFGGLGQHAAQGTNLVAFIPAASAAAWSYLRAGNIDKKLTLKMSLWGLLGMGLGVSAALIASEDALRKTFAVFLIGMAVVQFIAGEKKERSRKQACKTKRDAHG